MLDTVASKRNPTTLTAPARQSNVVHAGNRRHSRSLWRQPRWLAVSIARLIPLVPTSIQLLVFKDIYGLIIPPEYLLAGLAAYSLLAIFVAQRWNPATPAGRWVLAIDITISIFASLASGGFRNSLFLYGLVPVLACALYIDLRSTAVTALVCVAGGLFSLSRTIVGEPLTGTLLCGFFGYIAMICLASALPYLINDYTRQRMRYLDTLEERNRLSREMHDGVVQTTSALRWQIQVLRRNLETRGLDTGADLGELEALADRAQHEARESLDALRTYSGAGRLVAQVTDFLDRMKRDSGIDFQLSTPSGAVHVQPMAEIELLRICQEALNNVRRHSKAHHVKVDITDADGWLSVVISDDGCGFDVAPLLTSEAVQSQRHGLQVMKERAQTVGGGFWLLSVPGRGTEVRVEVPSDDGAQGRVRLWAKR